MFASGKPPPPMREGKQSAIAPRERPGTVYESKQRDNEKPPFNIFPNYDVFDKDNAQNHDL